MPPESIRQAIVVLFLHLLIQTALLHLIERDKLRQYIDKLYLYSRVQYSDYPEKEQRGLIIPTDLAGRFPDTQI